MVEYSGEPGPDFVCVGAQKAGTTWLYRVCEQHGSAWVPPVKEIHFFDLLCANEELLGVEGGKWPTGIRRLEPLLERPTWATLRWLYRFYNGFPSAEWYYSLYARDITGPRVTGDITPAYSTLDERGVSFARRVLKDECKILLILRNPIERVWSSIKMYHRWKDDSPRAGGLERLVARARSPSQRLRGDYVSMIRFWGSYFEGNFKVVLFDTLCDDPRSFLKDIFGFLNLSLGDLHAPTPGPVNVDPRGREMPEELYRELRDRYESSIYKVDELVPGVVDRWLR